MAAGVVADPIAGSLIKRLVAFADFAGPVQDGGSVAESAPWTSTKLVATIKNGEEPNVAPKNSGGT